jgi:ferrochelatase
MTAATAILLASFGGPEAPDEVMPFLEQVTAGRGVPRDRLEQVAEHYYALGGVSPINAQNRDLLAALRAEIQRRNVDLPVYWGNRNSAPYFSDALRDIAADGHVQVLALATSAYSSYSGCRQYRENLAAALAEADLVESLAVRKISPFFQAPGFVSPFTAHVTAAFEQIEREHGVGPSEVRVLFTTHSIPQAMALTSGPEPVETLPGVYEQQHLDVARAVMAGAHGGDVASWALVFQSRSGPPSIPWLEPDISDAIRAAGQEGVRALIVVPIGFVSDHMEVVWDLDHEALEVAQSLNLPMVRVSTPGVDPAFVSSLVDEIESSLTVGQESGSAPAGLCSLTCCANLRAELAVVPGTSADVLDEQ